MRGPSGCGKSTLLALIGGLARPTSGKVVVDGLNVATMSAAERAAFRAANVGFVFQLFHLLPYLDILQNVMLASSPENRRQAQDRALELLSRFGLQGRLHHRPAQLSAGERQRVAMARALLNAPTLLLADEPTGNLDPENAENVLQILADFHTEGGTIVLVTHDERAAAKAQRTIQLRAGRLDDAAQREVEVGS